MTEPIPTPDDQPIPYRRGRPFGIRSDILQKLQENTVTQRQISDIVDEGMGHLAQMRTTLEESDALLEDASGILADANTLAGTLPGIIDEGRQHAENAATAATAASQAVTDAQTHAGAAAQARTGAETALTGATTLLNDVDGEGTDFPTAITQVVTAHNDVLTKHQAVITAHGDVLEKHGEAITAATTAATEAGNAAGKALDAAATLTTVQGLHADTLGKHDEVLERHGEAITLAGNAAESALEAVEASNLAQQTGWAKLVATDTRNDENVYVLFGEGRTVAAVADKTPNSSADWSGEIFAKAYFENNTVQSAYATVPLVTTMALGGGNTNIRHIEVDYRRDHGVAQKRRQDNATGWQLPTNNEWHQYQTGEPWKISMTQTVAVTVLFRVGWDAAGYNGGYSLQARVNNVEVATVTNNSFGPQYQWQGSGYREQVLARSGNTAITVPAGQELTFWVRRDRSGTTFAPQERKIRHFDLTAVWTDPPA